MRLLKGLILYNFINLAVASTTASASESVEQFAENPTSEAVLTNWKSRISRRYSILSAEDQQPTIGSPERCQNSYEVYDSEDEFAVKVNPLKSSTTFPASPRKRSSKKAIGLSASRSGSFTHHKLLPSMPVDKPSGGESRCSSDSESHIGEGDSETIDDLLAKIPDRFVVNETSGVYKFDSEDEEKIDPFATSSDLMSKRSVLYRLLAEIYFFFDTMDLGGFRSSLTSSPAALQNQSLKYHLIDNLLTRSFKAKNEDTLRVLARFIETIDSASVSRSVGLYEKVVFVKFEQEIKKRQDSKKNSVQDPLKVALTNFITNESKRIHPLREFFASGDFDGAKSTIESSNTGIYVTMDDFSYLLKQECSSGRYNFLAWAIEFGYFHVHEMLGNQLITPLMLAAQATKLSNDIVKAILVKAPSTTTETDATGRKPLHYALNNNFLSRKQKKAIVKMLELESPTYESLNQILNKYASK